MEWNKNNPRYRRPGRRRKKGRRPGFFARLGAKLDSFLRAITRRAPKNAPKIQKLPQTPMTAEEIFDDLKISTPRARVLKRETPTPATAVLDIPAPATFEAEPAEASEDFELAEHLEEDYQANHEELDTEIYEELVFLGDSDEDDDGDEILEEEEADSYAQAEAADDLKIGAESRPTEQPAEPRPSGESRKSPRPPHQARPPWLKPAAIAALSMAVIGGIFLAARAAGLFDGEAPTAKVAKIPAASLPTVETPPPGLFENYAADEYQATSSEYVVEEGATLGHAMEAVGLGTRSDGAAIIECLTGQGGLELVRPGAVVRAYWLDAEKTKLTRLEYHPSSGDPPLVVRPAADGSFWLYKLNSPPLTVTTAAMGTVESTLWEAGSGAGLDAAIIMNMADIMASEIDFLADIQKGDSFQVLYSRGYADGRPVGGVNVEMLRMSNKGTDYELYRYVNGAGDVGYYDQQGRSSKKTFFNSPLQYTRISSGFNLNRLHPIYKVRRAHEGVDYAAPSGTPVSSVADGTVTFAGWSGGYGRLITIKHDEVHTTMYAHLSRFAKGLAKGDRVAQGDLIGYVGATGTATGPHLDFRMKRNNVFVDPQAVLSKQEGRMLEAAEAQAFAQLITGARNRLRESLEAAGS